MHVHYHTFGLAYVPSPRHAAAPVAAAGTARQLELRAGENGIIRVATGPGDIWQCGRSPFCIVGVFFGGGAVLYIPNREGRRGGGMAGGDVFPLQAYN